VSKGESKEQISVQSSGTESAVAPAEDAEIVVIDAEAGNDEAKNETKFSVNKTIVPSDFYSVRLCVHILCVSVFVTNKHTRRPICTSHATTFCYLCCP